MMMTNKENREEAIQRAKEEFGLSIVQEVQEVVYISDPDGAWSMFRDLEKYDHCAVIEMIYFE